MRKIDIKLANGEIVKGDEFDLEDIDTLLEIYAKIQEANVLLKSLGGRKLNIPDVFSEGLYCVLFNAVRTNGSAHSYDAIDKGTKEGIQIKSASIPKDCTSFGPKSTWDKLIYMDFAYDEEKPEKVALYEIPTEEVYGVVVNTSKNETFKEQQEQNRRPRFAIKNKIIIPMKLEPIEIIDLKELSNKKGGNH